MARRRAKRRTAKQRIASIKNLEIARKKKAKLGKNPKSTKLKVPGMRGKAKVPKGMRTNRATGTRLYGPNIYTP